MDLPRQIDELFLLMEKGSDGIPEGDLVLIPWFYDTGDRWLTCVEISGAFDVNIYNFITILRNISASDAEAERLLAGIPAVTAFYESRKAGEKCPKQAWYRAIF